MEAIQEKLLKLSYEEYMKLSPDERSAIRKTGTAMSQAYANKLFADNTNINYAIVGFDEDGKPKVIEKGKTIEIDAVSSGNSFDENWHALMKRHNKVLIAYTKGIVIERILIDEKDRWD